MLIVGQVIVGELSAFTILEPFVTDLVAADVEFPDFFRDAFKILGRVDPDSTLLVVVWFLVAYLLDGAVTCYGKTRYLGCLGFHQVKNNKLLPQGTQFSEQFWF